MTAVTPLALQAEEDAASRVEARLGPGVGAEAELRGWLEMGTEKCFAVSICMPCEDSIPNSHYLAQSKHHACTSPAR